MLEVCDDDQDAEWDDVDEVEPQAWDEVIDGDDDEY